MKKLLFIILMTIPFVAFGQTPSMGIFGNVVNTEDGTRLELSSRKDDGGGYNLHICCRYYDLGAGQNTFLAITIPSSKVESFKSQLKQIQTKYEEWVKTAKANNVQNVEKDIPVSITSVSDMDGFSLSYPEKKDIKAVFFVSNFGARGFFRGPLRPPQQHIGSIPLVFIPLPEDFTYPVKEERQTGHSMQF